MNKDPNKECCATCRYWLGFGDGNPMGICRQGPPTVICLGTQEEVKPPTIIGQATPPGKLTPILQTYFPAIAEGGWCGKHQFDKGRFNN